MGVEALEDARGDERAAGLDGAGDFGGVFNEHGAEDVGQDDGALVEVGGEVAGLEGDDQVVELGVFAGDGNGIGVVVKAADVGEAELAGGDGEDATAAAHVEDWAGKVAGGEGVEELEAGAGGGVAAGAEAHPRVEGDDHFVGRGGVGLPGGADDDALGDVLDVEEALPGLRPICRRERSALNGQLQPGHSGQGA